MSTHVEVFVPVPPVAPRLARWIGQAVDAALALHRALAARAERRHLVNEALALRQLAHEMESSMPSMAADLRRAADGVY